MSVRMNDPILHLTKIPYHHLIPERRPVRAVRVQIIHNKMKLIPGKAAKSPLHETNKHALGDCRTFNGKPSIQNENPLPDRMDCVSDVVIKITQPESVKNAFCAAYVTLINIAPQCMKREMLNSLIAGKMEQFGH